MQDEKNGAKALILSSILALVCPLLTARADASTHTQSDAPRAPTTHFSGRTAGSYNTGAPRGRPVGAYGRAQSQQVVRGGGISCVPYARNVSGINIGGNAWQWWDNAQGTYARGGVPQRGSVLAFRSNGRMRLGHVAVVSRVINARVIEIDHANWGATNGAVARGISVVDVSEPNNWTAVRVGLASSAEFGSVYPTYGFIYDRPDDGVMVAHNIRPAPHPVLNPVPSDLRPAAERPWRMYEEVAEAPLVRRAVPDRPDLPATGSVSTGEAPAGAFPVGGIDRK